MTRSSTPLILGIETTCDETAAAVVAGDKRVLAEAVFSQLEEHRPYGGIVPEIAARAHLQRLDAMIADVMAGAGLGYADLDAVAATAGPGLIGGVMVGMMTGKAIAAVHGKPFHAINHLEGHALSPRLTGDADFPYLLLLVSGGHCQLLVVEDVARYRPLGSTVDDAIGEAFDKVAKMLGLGYPGGPAVERAAASGAPGRFTLPRPMLGRPGCDFSFSGLKTAVRHAIDALPPGRLTETDKADLARDFQDAVTESVADRVANALAGFEGRTLVVAGGVAANATIRARLEAVAAEAKVGFAAPPLKYCTDNAAMIAWAAIERVRAGLPAAALDARARPRWPLADVAAEAAA